jgi:hypothetical protein
MAEASALRHTSRPPRKRTNTSLLTTNGSLTDYQRLFIGLPTALSRLIDACALSRTTNGPLGLPTALLDYQRLFDAQAMEVTIRVCMSIGVNCPEDAYARFNRLEAFPTFSL